MPAAARLRTFTRLNTRTGGQPSYTTARLALLMSLWSVLPVLAAPTGLLEIYQQARLNDPQLAAAGHSRQAAQELIEQAKAAYRPAVSLTANASQNHTDLKYSSPSVPLPAGVNSFQGYAARLEARQPLYRKENLERIDLSQVQVTLADKQYHLQQQQLMLRTTQAYFDVLQAQDHITLLEAQKQAVSEQQQQAKASFEAGISTITDVHEAQARYDLILAQEIAASNAQAIAQHTLQAITGKQPPALASVREDLQMTGALPALQAWQTATLNSSLDIQIQQAQVNVQQHQVAIARAGHYPTLDAVASYSDSHYNGSQNGFGNDLQNATIGVELNVPLYLGGAVDSRTRQAAYLTQRAQDDLEHVTRLSVLETQRAYLTLSSSMAQITALTQALKSSQSQLDATRLGYEVGIRTSVDLLNARQQLFSAKRDLLQVRYQYLVSMIRLKTASGIITEADIQEIDQLLVKHIPAP